MTIHAVDCPNLDALDYDKARLVDVDWDMAHLSTVCVKITTLTLDKPGMLANVSAAITHADANADYIHRYVAVAESGSVSNCHAYLGLEDTL